MPCRRPRAVVNAEARWCAGGNTPSPSASRPLPCRRPSRGHERGRMIRTTPFHERTSALNETGLWSHWSGHLAAEKYSLSEKFEYFAVRNAAGLFDTSPLFKYRFTGPDAGRFLAGVLARDPRKCARSKAQYTIWCDDRGFIVEDGVLLARRRKRVRPDRRRAELRVLRGARRPRHDVSIEDVSERRGPARVQGPRSRGLVAAARHRDRRTWATSSSRRRRSPACRSRSRGTGYTGDLGTRSGRRRTTRSRSGTRSGGRAAGQGVMPFGLPALYMTRIEAGLVLLDVDFHSSRFAWTDADRSTPLELGLGWMFRDLAPARGRTERRFIGARRDPRASWPRETSRWRLTGLVVDWQRLGPDLRRGGTHSAEGPHADPGGVVRVRRRGRPGRLRDEPHVFAGAPAAHRASPACRSRPAAPGSRVNLEMPVSHRYVHVGARGPAPAPLQPAAKDGLTMAKTNARRRARGAARPTRERGRTTRSSSARATTG